MFKSREFLSEKSRGRGFSLVASKQRSVAYGNKVMDTRLPQPAGCGDKYDVSGLGYRLLRSACNDGASNGEGLHRHWFHKILGTMPSMMGARSANSFGRSMIEMLGVLAIIGVLSMSYSLRSWISLKFIRILCIS